MRHTTLLIALLSLIYSSTQAQYLFRDSCRLKATEVKDQANTGTCWSFATASFIESELIRLGNEPIDLSEMFAVRHIYVEKARNYIFRQGKANFSQGGLAHDQLRAMQRYGAIPEKYYIGKQKGQKRHDHSRLEADIQAWLDKIIAEKNVPADWEKQLQELLDKYLGEAPKDFLYNGETHTPLSFAHSLGVNYNDYISITSFTHHPFYEQFVLEIPDNFSNGSYYNLPLSELEQTIDHALRNGYTIGWDGDVSEGAFSASDGLAILPEKEEKGMFLSPVPEQKVTQGMRQDAFEKWATTDDHLMHLVGMATDQKGHKYYILKNSWGEISAFKGYLYMSAPYMRMKTIAITLHRKGVPNEVAKKLKIN